MALTVEVVQSLTDIDPAAWDALLPPHNPFVEHAFLSLLETSKSAAAETGWMPLHLVVREGGALVGAAPCYLKDHSQGEYIFDYAWAEAAMRAGLDYYPKLVVAVPFTPATGPRLLARDDDKRQEVWRALIEGLVALTKETEAGGAHVLFSLPEEAAFLEEHGFLRRATHQFHWRNDGYGDFDDFLGALKSQARKQIRKERRAVNEAGLQVELRRGDELSAEEWSTLFALYQHTGSRKWGTPYLTRDFFARAGAEVGQRAVVCFARKDGVIVAGTLSFEKGRHLYGRYWGAFEEHDALHFELCYYRLLEYAIERGLTLVEAGAQGQHKLKRGFLPVVTHSAHRLDHPGLHDAVARAMAAERRHVEAEIAAAQSAGPFREETVPPFAPSAGVALPGEDAAG